MVWAAIWIYQLQQVIFTTAYLIIVLRVLPDATTGVDDKAQPK